MSLRTPKFGWVAAGLLLASTSVYAAPHTFKLTGSIAGIVRDSAGFPRLGATVFLYNRYEKLLQRAVTNEKGLFGFASLNPDVYSVRVISGNLIPALKKKISVQPGMQSLLYINMATVLSSVELVYAAPGQGALMSDDWKWTLKTATATRPVMRYLPATLPRDPNTSSSPSTTDAVFSDTRGMLKVSGGGGGSLAVDGDEDLGTAFALATSLFGRNQLQVSGNFGYSSRAGMPAASFRTAFSHDPSGSEISLTMHQVYLPTRTGYPLGASQDSVPALRTMSFGSMNRMSIGDVVRLEYGATLDSFSFLDQVSYISPFGRLTYDLGKTGSLQVAYSSGAPPVDLVRNAAVPGANTDALAETIALSHDLTALSMMPRISVHNGHSQVQRSRNIEVGYQLNLGRSDTLNMTGFHETVSNAALNVIAPDDLFEAGEVIPDISSRGSIVDAGGYSRNGYAASLTHYAGDHLALSAAAGRTGVLMAGAAGSEFGTTVDDLRSQIRTSQRFWYSARASATVPVTRTQIATSYLFTDYDALMPVHLYVTQTAYPELGWNVQIRQPIPAFGIPGRLEANVDLRNLLAQGYLPLTAVDGRRVLLMQSPRMLRGGVSFIF